MTKGNEMAKAIAAYNGGIHGLIEFGVRADGALFRRVQNKDHRFGYVWSGWKFIRNLDVNDIPQSIEAGFSVCYHAGQYSNWKKWRLPND